MNNVSTEEGTQEPGAVERRWRAFLTFTQPLVAKVGSEIAELLSKQKPIKIEEVLSREFKAIHGFEPTGDSSSPTLKEIQRQNYQTETAALCLSGGGIRSAAFGLGVVQALARIGLFKRFHYLSTVSGGGYTGSFLSAWAYRADGGVVEVENKLNERRPSETEEARERDPLRRLRRFSSYLSPRVGVVSLDTWTLATTYLRNLFLNWLVLLPILVATVCVPMLITAFITGWPAERDIRDTLLISGMVCTLVGIFLLRLRTYSAGDTGVLRTKLRNTHKLVLMTLIIGGISVSAARYSITRDPTDSQIIAIVSQFSGLFEAKYFLKLLGVVGLSLGILFLVLDLFRTRRRWFVDRVILIFGFLTTIILTGMVIVVWMELFPWWLHLVYEDTVLRGKLLVVLSTPAWLCLLMLPEALFVGLAGKLSDDHDREWWARAVAIVLQASAIWVVAGCVVLLGPIAVDWIHKYAKSLSLNYFIWGILALLGGLVARRGFVWTIGQQDKVGNDGTSLAERIHQTTLNVVGAALIIMLFAGLATAIEGGLQEWGSESSDDMTPPFPYKWTEILLATSSSIIVAMFFGYFVHINRFSLHAMYRDRLSRAFLAASRWKRKLPVLSNGEQMGIREPQQFEDRAPDDFTGFDSNDNPLLQWLNPARRQGVGIFGEAEFSEQDTKSLPFINAPFLVINCALNLVGDRDVALQERKADSFTFTTQHAGSTTTGYRPATEYGGPDGVTVGTAMTISGAAVSPNAGSRSTPVMTFLMTIFNARLGWWLGNPSDAGASQLSGPRVSVTQILCELLGRTDAKGSWIHLSDGGHFDNLGVYEMVRRGCRYIVVSDASADPDQTFEDLGNVVRKVRIDLGIEITRLGEFHIGTRDLGVNGRYAALFAIEYPEITEEDEPGLLLYLKPSIYRLTPTGAPIDVVQYGSRSGTFPHEPTSNQFYMESQFESYRALGEHEMSTLMVDPTGNPKSVRAIFDTAMNHIKSSSSMPT